MPISDQLSTIEKMIFSSSSQSVLRIIELWPSLLGALGVILVGWAIGHLVEYAILGISKRLDRFHLGQKTGFSHFLQRAGVKRPASEVVATFLNGYVVTIFFIAAARILHLDKIEEFLNSVIAYIPNLVIALFILLIGAQVGTTVARVVESALSLAESRAAKIIGLAAKSIIVVFAVMAALIELKIAENFVEILFIGFVSMITISGGLAFGLGGKDLVRELLEDLRHHKSL